MPPINDLFASRTTITGSSGRWIGSNVGATVETNEPFAWAGTAFTSIWFSWTAPTTGRYKFDLYGSDFDTVLEIFTGTILTALTVVTGNDDSQEYVTGLLQSMVKFSAISGHTYIIYVRGYSNSSGNIQLNWAPFPTPLAISAPTSNQIKLIGSHAIDTHSSFFFGRYIVNIPAITSLPGNGLINQYNLTVDVPYYPGYNLNVEIDNSIDGDPARFLSGFILDSADPQEKLLAWGVDINTGVSGTASIYDGTWSFFNLTNTFTIDAGSSPTWDLPSVIYNVDALLRSNREVYQVDAVLLDRDLDLKISELYFEVIRSNNFNDRDCVAQSGWWNCNYPYRRRIEIDGPRLGVVKNHPVSFVISNQKMLDRGKIRGDLADVEVVFRSEENDIDPWAVLDRSASLSGDNLSVAFPLSVDLTEGQVAVGEYYVYYGNLLLRGGVPARRSYTSPQWPVSVGPLPEVTYTHPGSGWTLSDTIATTNIRGEHAAFDFASGRIRLRADTGPSNGIAQIQIDFGEWQDIDLFSLGIFNNQVVFSTDELAETFHTIRVRCSGRANPGSTGTSINVRGFDYKKLVGAVDIHEEIIRLRWTTSHGGVIQ